MSDMEQFKTYGRPIEAGGLTAAYTSAAGATSAVNKDANCIRVVSTTDCFIRISTAGTAAAANTGLYLPAFTPEYFDCPPKAIVSAIRVSADGSIYVSPFA
jgi:hypothetical protein